MKWNPTEAGLREVREESAETRVRTIVLARH